EQPDEVLAQSPATRYLVGMLAPSGTPVDETEDETGAVAETDELEETPPLIRTLTPSSIGISFVVDRSVPRLEAKLSWGEYMPETTKDLDDKRRQGWRRVPKHLEVVVDPAVPDREFELGAGVVCRWISRSHGVVWIVSVFLVNK